MMKKEELKDKLLHTTCMILGIIISFLIFGSAIYFFTTYGIYGSTYCTDYPPGNFIGLQDSDFNSSYEAQDICNKTCPQYGKIHEGDCNAIYCECINE